MKIIKLDLNKETEIIKVRTDKFPLIEFNFPVEQIIDRNDLILKINQRVSEELKRAAHDKAKEAWFQQFKNLEGKDISDSEATNL